MHTCHTSVSSLHYGEAAIGLANWGDGIKGGKEIYLQILELLGLYPRRNNLSYFSTIDIYPIEMQAAQ